MEIKSNAQLERIRGQDQWQVLTDFEVVLSDKRSIIVPHNFLTDKASVPFGLAIKRDDKHIIDGALIHDYLYFSQKIEGQWIKRKEADKILIDICKYSGMGFVKRFLVYQGVRIGGWTYFNKRAIELGNIYHAKRD